MATDRRLVVFEAGASDPDKGRMFALAPGDATGVAIPAFKTAQSLPPVGSVQGEGIYDLAHRQGFVWSGSAWLPIAPNPIKTYLTEALLRSDTSMPVGTYATAGDTGNLFIYRQSGWAQVGIGTYATVTALLADNPAVGGLGEALDEGSLWEMTSSGWRCMTMRELANTAAVSAWTATPVVASSSLTITTPNPAVGGETVAATINGTLVSITAAAGNTPAQVAEAFKVAAAAALPALTFSHAATTAVVGITGRASGAPLVITLPSNVTAAVVTAGRPLASFGVNIGDRAMALDVDVTYIRTASGWRPTNIWEAPNEAAILATTWCLEGQEAIAADTGHTYIRRNGAWQQDPIQHFPTETALKTATPPDGTLAWADDTAKVFARAGGRWVGMNTGFDDPIPLGTICPIATAAAPSGWLLCDGSAIPAGAAYDALRTLLAPATTVPDLRGMFLRGARAGDTLFSTHAATTGQPTTPFTTHAALSLSTTLQVTGNTSQDPGHKHNIWGRRQNHYSGYGFTSVPQTFAEGIEAGGVTITDGQFMDTGGGHQHTLTGTATGTISGNVDGTVNGGGDAETAPAHTMVHYAIKAFHVTQAAPSGTLAINITSPANRQVLAFDAVTNSWVNKAADYIPLHRGAFGVGSKQADGSYLPPTTPAEGDIWVDKNLSPPAFKVYRNGAWVLVNWQTDHLGLLSDLANVDVGASGSPAQGDALIFNQLTEKWESGAVPAHITEYDRNTSYSAGTTVYYKGGLFEAKTRTTGVSPEFQLGDVWFFHRANVNGSGDWQGPFDFETVNIVTDATVAPTATHPTTDTRPHWTLQWQDNTHWSIWKWDLDTTGWRPGNPLPVATWHRYDSKFAAGKAHLWRNYSSPPHHVGDLVLWLYDGPMGTAAPHQRALPWTLRQIRGDIYSLHDVDAENPANGDVLVFNSTRSLWEARPPAGGSGVYVREGQLTLATNLADQYMELLSGIENHTLSYDISLWETGATENQGGPLLRFRLAVRRNGTSSIYLDDLHYSAADFFTGIYSGWVGSSHKVSLRTAAGYNGRILHVRIESEQSDLTNITFGSGATTAAVSGNAAERTWASSYQKGELLGAGDLPNWRQASQVDRLLSANDTGNLQFSRYLRTYQALDGSSSVAGIDFKGNGSRAMANASFTVEGHIKAADDSSNTTIGPFIQWADDSIQDFASTSSGIVHPYNTDQYDGDGTSDKDDTLITNHGCRFNFKSLAVYCLKYGTVMHFRLNGMRNGAAWYLSWEGSYRSSNDTPFIFRGGCQINRNSDIRFAGIKMYQFNNDVGVLCTGAVTGEWMGPA